MLYRERKIIIYRRFGIYLRVYISCCCFLSTFVNVRAQDTLGLQRSLFSIAGAVVENKHFSFSWSLGEALAGEWDGLQAALPTYAIEDVLQNKPQRPFVEVYPTIVTTNLYFRTSIHELPVHICFFDLSGSLVLRAELYSESGEIPLPPLGSKMYILKMYNASKEQTVKLIRR